MFALQEEIITIRALQLSQTQEFIGECTGAGPAQSTPPTMIEMNINSVVKGQCRGHLKGVGCQLSRVPSSSSTATSASTSTLVYPPIVPPEYWGEFTRIL